MKIILIIIAIIALAFIAIQVFAMKGQKNIETYKYEVTKKYETFEIRAYEASLFTSVKLSGNQYKEESGKACPLRDRNDCSRPWADISRSGLHSGCL